MQNTYTQAAIECLTETWLYCLYRININTALDQSEFHELGFLTVSIIVFCYHYVERLFNHDLSQRFVAKSVNLAATSPAVWQCFVPRQALQDSLML